LCEFQSKLPSDLRNPAPLKEICLLESVTCESCLKFQHDFSKLSTLQNFENSALSRLFCKAQNAATCMLISKHLYRYSRGRAKICQHFTKTCQSLTEQHAQCRSLSMKLDRCTRRGSEGFLASFG